MNLRGVEFDNMFCAPGTFGYFGEKKPLYFKYFLKHSTFVTQIVTFSQYKQAIVKAKKDFWNIFSSSNKVSKVGAGVILSKEDISNPGLEDLLKMGEWQSFKKPFLISVASLKVSKNERFLEMRETANILLNEKGNFKTQFGINICLFDPEDNDYDAFIEEACQILNIFSILGVPLVVQVSLSLPPDVIEQIASNQYCDAISENTFVLWESFPKDARKAFFQFENSPISLSSGGYVFGKYIEPLSVEWTRQAKKYNQAKPLLAGGGVIGPKNIDTLIRVGAQGFIVDQSVFLRPWNIKKIMKRAKINKKWDF
jgi:hypothetical protein